MGPVHLLDTADQYQHRSPVPACLQVIGHHGNFLRKVLKGCLLSRKVTLLQSLVQLKKQAATLTKITAALHIEPDDMGESLSELDTAPKGDLHMMGLEQST